jgi:ribosomal protein S18 acetylase RimI-like enzyme
MRHAHEPAPFVIRPAAVGDAEALAALAEKTFRDAFAADNDPGDMDEHCRRSFSPAIQREQIADPLIVTLVAIHGQGHMAGFAQLRPGSPAQGFAPEPIELWRFYVDAAYHGRGLAQQLMDAMLEAAAQRGARTIWLGVWERNGRAQNFYRKSGFVDIGSHGFTLGSDPQTDRLMARSIA